MGTTLAFAGERPNKEMQAQGMGDSHVGAACAGAEARHPVEKLLIDNGRRAERQEFQCLSMVHGVHAPLRLKMERELLSQFQRLPGLPSSLAGLETVLGIDETIQFENVLNLDVNNPNSRNMGPNFGVHDVMEARLGMRF